MRTFSLRGGLLAALALFVALMGQVGRASAHAELVSSTPAANSTVTTAPARVVAVFSEELASSGSLLKVTDSKGTAVDTGDSALDRSDAQRKTLVVGLKANLPADTYTVNWTSVASDGHSETGSFMFKVAGATSTTPATPPPALPTTGDSGTPAGALLLLALLALGAGLGLRRAR